MLSEQEIEFLYNEIDKITKVSEDSNNDILLSEEEALDTKAKKVYVYDEKNRIIATLHLNNYFYKIFEKNMKNNKIKLMKYE